LQHCFTKDQTLRLLPNKLIEWSTLANKLP